MPPKQRIARDMIVDAAFTIARTEGAENINARRLAQVLGCSTQPVLYHFASMEDVRRAAYEKADRFHADYIMDLHGAGAASMLEIGLRYIRFAAEEKHLFRFLFQSDRFAAKSLTELIDAEEMSPILSVLRQAAGVGPEAAREVFLSLFLFVHGYASMLANNSMVYEEKQIVRQLYRAFMGGISAAGGEKR